jgi:2-(1,2-epoxy-1,2-dihydrophenyl)acetyl-CoA isomerase
MTYSKLKVATDGEIAIVTLCDPGTMNSAGVGMAEELLDALQRTTAPGAGTRAIILTGEGRGFCSGANLGELIEASGLEADGRIDAGLLLDKIYNELVTFMRDLPVPLVVAVNGAAAGVGCSFALLGDIIVAAESAYFLQAFRRVGLIPDGGSTYMLPRIVGKARAMEMALLGERVSAAKALEWGLINRCVPDGELMATALGLARQLANGPASLGLTRRAIWAGLDSEWAEQLKLERAGQRVAGKTDDFTEGLAAFLEKRPAVFGGG